MVLDHAQQQVAVLLQRSIDRDLATFGWDKTLADGRRAGIKVSKGDRLRITADYDSTHSWDDVMGIMAGAFVPDR